MREATGTEQKDTSASIGPVASKGRTRAGLLACATLALCATALALALLAPAGAQALEAELRDPFCTNGSTGGKCSLPRGVAVDPLGGDIYVADQGNKRIQKFTAWGEFTLAWGWDVVASGPGDDTDPPENELEVCVAADGDVCQGAQAGGSTGQFDGTQGIALDGAGDVYVVDRNNHRVQKFSPEGEFLLMFGGGVNKTKVDAAAPEAEQNRCPVDPGDVCQAGVTGAGDGEFETWPVGSFIAAGADGDTIYVGDVGRIQEFDREGNYLGNLPDPSGFLAANTVHSLAVDPRPTGEGGGDLYLAVCRQTAGSCAPLALPPPTAPGVRRLNPETGAQVGAPLAAGTPTALAVDKRGHAYVFDGRTPGENEHRRILEFNENGNLVGLVDENPSPIQQHPDNKFNNDSTGLAASNACGLEGTDVVAANSISSPSFLRLYGPPPDPDLCPPPSLAPGIEDAWAASVGTEAATVRATIDPNFWPDTRYYVQYGTGPCTEGGCGLAAPAPPGALLTDRVVKALLSTKGVFLEGLQPATTYHYRFVAVSSGGGPAEGPEGTFTTRSAPGGAGPACPNDAFRTGFGAQLPECRAYELVSPLDKNNGDIVTDEVFGVERGSLKLASPDGSKATFSSFASFADPEASTLVNQFLAKRSPVGWATHSISPPRTSVPFYGPTAAANFSQFKTFTPDLCQGWFIQDTDFELDPGQPAGVASLYRRDDQTCGAKGYELLTPGDPAGFPTASELETGESAYFPTLQGVSADSGHALMRIDAALDDDACRATIKDDEENTIAEEAQGIFQVYLHTVGSEELDVVSVLPSGVPACVHSSGGTAQGIKGGLRDDSVLGALSEDASRAFWSTSAATGKQSPAHVSGGGGGNQTGPLYVRLNPAAEPSPQQSGSATGAGDLLGPAAATGTVINKLTTVANVEMKSGSFSVGQQITDSNGGIPAGTTITKVQEGSGGTFTLTLSAQATKTKVGDELSGLASPTVANLATATGAFAPGQSISGPGIAPGTTVAAVQEAGEEAVGLTLSASATASVSGAALEAWSACTEPGVKACTRQISGATSARFWGADPQGTTAIYTAGGGLFEYDVEADESTEIAPSGVQGVMGMSTDASRIYFSSSAALTGSQENGRGEVALAGKPNLYLHRRGEEPLFIATLSALDVGTDPLSPVAAEPDERVSRVSPDGDHAAFLSAAALSGAENTDVNNGRADAEVFLFDAPQGGGVGELACISCNPTGARPAGRDLSRSSVSYWATAELPPWESQFHPSRALSEDGERLFFESFQDLVLGDTNEARDVYEWRRAASAAECAGYGFGLYSADAGGCIGLISSGKDPLGAEFLDASASGSDVFFTTAADLLSYDFGLVDVYDARAGGGLPGPAKPEPSCAGEACRPASAPPDVQTPASAAFAGPGNASPAPAGRCGRIAARAKRVSRRAKRLRRAARRAGAHGPRSRMRRAARNAKRARALTGNAKRCRARARRGARR